MWWYGGTASWCPNRCCSGPHQLMLVPGIPAPQVRAHLVADLPPLPVLVLRPHQLRQQAGRHVLRASTQGSHSLRRHNMGAN